MNFYAIYSCGNVCVGPDANRTEIEPSVRITMETRHLILHLLQVPSSIWKNGDHNS